MTDSTGDKLRYFIHMDHRGADQALQIVLPTR
ncbi:MAG: hypothetical protein ACI8QS_001790 [Planctomycetota bacterium]|jgi:hypothetical protein